MASTCFSKGSTFITPFPKVVPRLGVDPKSSGCKSSVLPLDDRGKFRFRLIVIIYAYYGGLFKRKIIRYDTFYSEAEVDMAGKTKEPTWEDRASRFLKAELKRADVTYEELAVRLKRHGLAETKASIAAKLGRGTFPATF